LPKYCPNAFGKKKKKGKQKKGQVYTLDKTWLTVIKILNGKALEDRVSWRILPYYIDG